MCETCDAWDDLRDPEPVRVYVYKFSNVTDAANWWVDCDGCGRRSPISEHRTHAAALAAAHRHLRRTHADV